MRPTALLLDLDGTLIDRDGALRSWLDAYRSGADLSPRASELVASLGQRHVSVGHLARALLTSHPQLAPDPAVLAARIRAELPGFLRPDPTVLAALDRLADAGLRLALVSNGGGRTQRAKLAAAGITLERFDAIAISDELGLAKPDPGIFEHALRELAIGRRDVMMIGDSPEHDVAGAAGAGLRSCWIARGRAYPDAHPPPSLRARSFPVAVDRLLG